MNGLCVSNTLEIDEVTSASDFEFWIEVNISSSRHSKSNLLTILVSIDHSSKSLNILDNNAHQRETIHDKSILFAKLVSRWKSKE